MERKSFWINRFFFISLFAAVFLLFSCEKVIDLPLKDAQSLLVIEGNVDDFATFQEVLLSRSTPFNYTGDRIPVSGAVVNLREGDGRVMELTEEEAGRYVIKNFRGKPGNTYYLSVLLDGEEYTAQSTMPRPVIPDSVGTVTTSALSETVKSVAVIYTDPEDQKNYYRFKLKINQVGNRSYWVYNDRFNNGKTITQTLTDFSNKIVSKDEVEVQMQCIDSAIYQYWTDLKDQGPGASTPANPISNISNGSLGYFSANSVSYTVFQVR